jgi:riboflavin synthase
MFTGLIKEVGSIQHIEHNDSGLKLTVQAKLFANKLHIGDSVAINGVCLTIIELNNEQAQFQVIHTTLDKSNISSLKISSPVNLEPALRLGDSLGGHWVQGHINAQTKVEHITAQGQNYVVTFSLAENLNPYFIEEGSVTIDGVSLTVAYLTPQNFSVSIIPHTWTETLFHHYQIGTSVNIEVDAIAKYAQKWLSAWQKQKG